MRILVVDDHALFCDGIISLLETAGHKIVGQVGNGQSAVEAALHLCPDLVLKAKLPEAPVVMLTVSDSDDDLFEAAMTRQTATRLLKGFASILDD